MVKSQQKQLKMNTDQMAANEQQIIVDYENLTKARRQAKANEDLRQYYQHLLLKLVRDIELLKDKPQSLQQFQKISEFQDHITDQEYYKRLLTEINIEEELIAFVNR